MSLLTHHQIYLTETNNAIIQKICNSIIMTFISFYDLSPDLALNQSDNKNHVFNLWQNLFKLLRDQDDIKKITLNFTARELGNFRDTWQNIDHNDDEALTDWLIKLFNQMFNQKNIDIMPTILVRGENEPEYFPSEAGSPARIEFAHGFFASALHEISHWCIAGKHRRTLNDFGYWYESDGRDEQTQAIFEQVEIKPQAIECLLNQACGRYFYVSQDNLNADFDTTKSTFAHDVYEQANQYLNHPDKLPRDARRLIWMFLTICQNFQ